jgi:ribonuclease E
LRLRDSGGLVVVDFIDMSANRNQRAVEERLRKALAMDRARTQVGKISRFGLLEMSRQRLRSSLGESSYHTCPRCNGQGTIRSVESLALSILRLIEEEAMKDGTGRVVAQVPVSIATFLLNEKRRAIALLEGRHSTQIMLVPNITLDTPRYEITREREDEVAQNAARSYTQANDFSETDNTLRSEEEIAPALQPAVRSVKPVGTAPERKPQQPEAKKEENSGLIKRLFTGIFGEEKKQEEEKVEQPAAKDNRGRGRGNNRGRRRSSGGGKRQGQQQGQGRKAADDRENKAPEKSEANKPAGRRRRKPTKQQTGNQEQKSTANAQTEQPAQEKKAEDGKPESQPKSGQRRGRRRGPRRSNNRPENTTAEQSGKSASNESKSDTTATQDKPQRGISGSVEAAPAKQPEAVSKKPAAESGDKPAKPKKEQPPVAPAD